jgi:hypothetical protein
MAKLLGSVRKKMLTVGLPAVLDDLDDAGTLRASAPSGPTYRAVQDRRLNPTVTSQPQGSEP